VEFRRGPRHTARFRNRGDHPEVTDVEIHQ
jgi:hypothetical protein